jgi:hypothetical protein
MGRKCSKAAAGVSEHARETTAPSGKTLLISLTQLVKMNFSNGRSFSTHF